MENRYKIILSSNNLYKEIELSPESKQLKVGTGIECEVRLRKELFFGTVELTFVNSGNGWTVLCSDNLYLTMGDVRKLVTKNLQHGDTLQVMYQDSDNQVFTMEFIVDFNDGKRKYERVISVKGFQSFSIGNDLINNIVIKSQYVTGDAIYLVGGNGKYVLDIHKTTYGVYLNGKKAKSGETVKSGDFLSVSDFFFYLKDDCVYTEIRDDITVNGLTYSDSPMKNEYPKFKQNTRIKTVVNNEKIEILDPPAKPQEPKNNLFTRLLPSMGMLVASCVMAAFGGYMIIMSMISGGMAIVTAVINFRESKKEFKKAIEDRERKYKSYIDKKEEEITQIRREELEELEEIYVSQDVEKNRLMNFSSDLFDRTKEDEDFLCVRLGSGDVEASREVTYKKQEKLEVEDEFQLMPEKISKDYKYIHNAPIVCDLKDANAIAVVGDENNRFDVLKNIVIDVAARHYHTDVKMVFVAEEANRNKVHWLRMLPHAYNDAIGARNIVCEAESKNLIFEYLYKELTYREQSKKSSEHIIVFLYDECGIKGHPISKFIGKAKDLGITFIFFGDDRAEAPQGCKFLVSIIESGQAVLIDSEDKGKSVKFSYPILSDEQAKEIVSLLAPVYTDEISLEGTLTKNISMFELLNILAVDDLDLGKRWAGSQVFRSMSAPLGVSKTGIVELDLHDKAHGPHGLVAGTTGSGKSEILQTYILAMSTLFHPYEVGFVIIDFKGGGMVNQFRDLPHLLGAITNIDGKEINRSLKSIKAELQKRQRLFKDADVNHIDKYIRKYKAGEVATPLPHLIIIVDEFAELKAEQPEFMKELISAARIGRSLGVHLILATQKPSGQVNEQIWSNSRFKLCLKVQSQEDSNEVIKSPLAAEIKEPGRAYLQVGNNEIFELFQSAYSGAPEKMDDSSVKEFAIYQMLDSGKKLPVYVQKNKKKDESGEGDNTQLKAIVDYVSGYCKGIKLPKLPDICLPALEKVIDFPEICREQNISEGIVSDIGIYDDPDRQYQGQYSVNLTNDNVMIIGSAQSGKTNILQTMIKSLTSKYSPSEVNIYIIDFASMVLKSFEKLNHVGGVVTSSEDEKLKNLFKLLQGEIEIRKEKLVSVGVSSFASYLEAGRKDLPQIVLFIDNLTALKELYFQDDDQLLTLCREGLSAGITVVIANTQTTGIGYKYLSSFSSRIALYCNDSAEYSSLFEHCRERLDSISGRGFISVDKQMFECQMYLAYKGEKEIERAEAIREYVESCNSKNASIQAKIIPLIPSVISMAYVRENYEMYMRNNALVVVGVDYGSVMPVTFDLASLGVLVISGREKSGKSNFIKYMIQMLEKIHPDTSEVYVADGVNRKLDEIRRCDNVKSYEVLAEKAIESVLLIEEKLSARYEKLAADMNYDLAAENLLVLVLNNYDAVEAVCNNASAIAAYRNITGKYKSMKVCVLLGDYENCNVPYGAAEIIKRAKDMKHFMFFDDLANLKILDLPLAVLRENKKPIEIGDAYYIKDNECVRVKTALSLKGV